MMQPVFIIALALTTLPPAAAQTAPLAAARIHAGPVYTLGVGCGPYPEYPEMQIQVDVPPGVTPEMVKPETFRLKTDNGSVSHATEVQTLASTGYGIATSVALDV